MTKYFCNKLEEIFDWFEVIPLDENFNESAVKFLEFHKLNIWECIFRAFEIKDNYRKKNSLNPLSKVIESITSPHSNPTRHSILNFDDDDGDYTNFTHGFMTQVKSAM